jgi:hypothetical protein
MAYLAWLGALPLFLAPAFAAGFAMQQYLEGVDAFILWLGRTWATWAAGRAGNPFAVLVNGINQTYANTETIFVKKLWLGVIGFMTALGVVFSLKLFLMHDLTNIGSVVAQSMSTQAPVPPFQRYAGSPAGPWAPEDLGDHFVTALIITAGTTFFNSLLKWVEAAKDLKQSWANTQQNTAARIGTEVRQLSALAAPPRQPAESPSAELEVMRFVPKSQRGLPRL